MHVVWRVLFHSFIGRQHSCLFIEAVFEAFYESVVRVTQNWSANSRREDRRGHVSFAIQRIPSARHGKLTKIFRRTHNDVDIFRRRASPPLLVLVAFAVWHSFRRNTIGSVSSWGEIRLILPTHERERNYLISLILLSLITTEYLERWHSPRKREREGNSGNSVECRHVCQRI